MSTAEFAGSVVVVRAVADPHGATRRFGMLAAVTVGLVILADWLFWERPRGWTVGAYGLLLAVAVWLCAWRPPGLMSAALTAAVAGVLLQCLEEPGLLAVGLGILGLFTLGLVLREGWTSSTADWLRRWGLLVAVGWLSAPRDLVDWNRACRAAPQARPVVRLLGKWSVPIVLSIWFLALFAAANPVISQWLGDAWRGVRAWWS